MPKAETRRADLKGGWSIEYVYGYGSVNRAKPEQALHVLRVMGDITRPDALREAVDTWRLENEIDDGPTILHTPLGEMNRFPAPVAKEVI